MSACACMGPPGDCPCIRQAKGMPTPATEIYIANSLFQLLTEEEKLIINNLKMKALARSLFNQKDS